MLSNQVTRYNIEPHLEMSLNITHWTFNAVHHEKKVQCGKFVLVNDVLIGKRLTYSP